jgi:hypothetical protein
VANECLEAITKSSVKGAQAIGMVDHVASHEGQKLTQHGVLRFRLDSTLQHDVLAADDVANPVALLEPERARTGSGTVV